MVQLQRPVPPPIPYPHPEQEQTPPFLLAIIVCVSAMLGIHRQEITVYLEVLQASDDPIPAELRELIQRPLLTVEEKRSVFRRMVAYAFRTPLGDLLNELLRQQRTVEAWPVWRNPERYQPDSLTFMVVTVAVLATHIDINATHVIDVFQPFVVHHIDTDVRLAPLLEMLRIPVAVGNFRLGWRERIIEAFIQLSGNLTQNQARG
jgi:hypothetical protein